jgi:hypothetical protein
MTEAPKTEPKPEQLTNDPATAPPAEQPAAKRQRKAATPKPPATIGEQLRQKFPAGVVKQRTIRNKQFDYVAIDATIGRLLDTLGLEWSFTNASYDVQPALVARRDADPVQGWQCIVTGELVIHDAAGHQSVHWGVGADIADDLDKALKTALAEALKKAGHQVGIGLYLWRDEERQALARERKLVGGNVAALKTELIKRNNLTLGPVKEDNVKFLSEFFHVLPEQLDDPVVLQQLLGMPDAEGGEYQ